MDKDIVLRRYCQSDLPQMTAIWNEVIAQGKAFPQDRELSVVEAAAFFAGQSYCAVAEQDGRIAGLYILHPNNIGRCGHLANASYAVSAALRGAHIGERLVVDSLQRARELGFRVLQFNAVVADNAAAIHLYHKLGFTQLGTVPGGFLNAEGCYDDIVLFYKTLL